MNEREGRSRLSVAFYKTARGSEPVRDWMTALRPEDMLTIGADIATIQRGWPLGMPVVRKLEPGLWELRSRLADGIARVLFTVDGGTMVLLHAFAKKTHRIPMRELQTARRRREDYRNA